MRVLLDTYVLITALTQGIGQMPVGVQRLLELPNTERLFSAVSITEIAIKVSIGKLEFAAGWIAEAAADLKIDLLPYLPRHAQRLFDLPLHHRDPFDRMLIATAVADDLPLISRDRHFKKYEDLKVIW